MIDVTSTSLTSNKPYLAKTPLALTLNQMLKTNK